MLKKCASTWFVIRRYFLKWYWWVYRQVLHPPHITGYPLIPFGEVSFDYKPRRYVRIRGWCSTSNPSSNPTFTLSSAARTLYLEMGIHADHDDTLEQAVKAKYAQFNRFKVLAAQRRAGQRKRRIEVPLVVLLPYELIHRNSWNSQRCGWYSSIEMTRYQASVASICKFDRCFAFTRIWQLLMKNIYHICGCWLQRTWCRHSWVVNMIV